MNLKKGVVLTTKGQESITVQEQIGAGAQGTVYRVTGSRGDQALKWYRPRPGHEQQLQAVKELIQDGKPSGPGGERFLWPTDLVESAEESGSFGYLMPLLEERFTSIGKIRARVAPRPSLRTLCRIGFELAQSYRALHLSGRCYVDVNTGNLALDPTNGEIRILDCDNIGVNNHSEAAVVGTFEFMAPEIVRGTAKPSIASDLYSLAVLYFLLFVSHHPLHGRLWWEQLSWDIPAKRILYGKSPWFVFDPKNTANHLPTSHEFEGVRKRWDRCPATLRAAFLRSFTEGMRAPQRRVREGEWQALFLQLEDICTSCSSCNADLFIEAEVACCPYCGVASPASSRATIHHAGGRSALLLDADRKLLARHLNLQGGGVPDDTVLGTVLQHPAHPERRGLRNLSSDCWYFTREDGIRHELLAGETAALSAGMRFKIQGQELEVMS